MPEDKTTLIPIPLGNHGEVVRAIAPTFGKDPALLKKTEENWQPSDLLPTLADKTSSAQLCRLQEEARALPDALLVVLAGNMITEDGLSCYQSWLNSLDGIADQTGTANTPWARWVRTWAAEENRHGIVLTEYLFLTGRVNMRMVEVTTQFLIRNGFNPGTESDPYKGLIYTSFQERATKISHSNVAKLSRKCGDRTLTKICSSLAGDEARHEETYKRVVKKIFELDPSGAICAFAEIMRGGVAMPAKLMYDGGNRDIFSHYSMVAQRIGIYTTRDYAGIIRHLLDEWGVPSLSSLSSKAMQAQEYLCGLPERYIRLADILEGRSFRSPKIRFSWVFDRAV